MLRTRWIRKLMGRHICQGQGRRQTAQTRKPIRLMLESLEDRLAPAADPTTVLAGNANVNFSGNNPSPAFNVAAAVNDNLGGTATSGTVSVYLEYNGSTPPPPVLLGTATVGANGTANVSVAAGSLPTNLQTGNYQLEETYSGNASFAASDAFGTLTVSADPTSVVVGNATINDGSNSSFTIAMGVNSPNGTVNSGSVSVSLVNDNTTTTLGTATVSGGTATLSVTNPSTLSTIAALAPGNYQLTETYNDVTNGQFATSTSSGTLKISADATNVVAGSATVSYSDGVGPPPAGGYLIPLGPNASNYAVLYEGTGGNNLSIGSAVINGNIGVGGTGAVQFGGAGAINGSLDFSAANSGQFHNTNAANVGPNSVSYSATATTNALTTVNALNGSLTGLGNNIAISGNETINENAGQLVVINGAVYRVFNVTSYNENNGDLLTINSDGSGIPVVFNFAMNSNVNLGGDVDLNGLSADQVLWNFTNTGQNVTLNTNASSSPTLSFQGTILAPNDVVNMTNANLIGRIFGGDSGTMQLASGDKITAPPLTPTPPPPPQPLPFTIQVGINSSNGSVNSGTVAIDLVSDNTVTLLGTATVTDGTATLSVTNPVALATIATLTPGAYQLTETFNDVTNGHYATSTGLGTLTVNTIPASLSVSSISFLSGSTSPFVIPVSVTTPFGQASGGEVTLTLTNGTLSIPLGTGTVGPNGVATITVTGIPLSELSLLPPGQYQLQINYTSPTGSTTGSTSTITGFQVSPMTGTTLIPGNAVSTAEGGPVTIPVLVSNPSGTVTTGTVTISLVTPNGTSVIGSAPVTNGQANVPATIPSNLMPGDYSLVENYGDSTGTFPATSGTGTLTVQPLPIQVAALRLAVDAAELALLSTGNFPALQELQLFADVFLHYPIPSSPGELVPTIQSLYPQTGPLGLPAIGAGMFLAQDLQIENPMPSSSGSSS